MYIYISTPPPPYTTLNVYAPLHMCNAESQKGQQKVPNFKEDDRALPLQES